MVRATVMIVTWSVPIIALAASDVPPTKPSDTVRRYYAAMKQGRCGDAFALLTTEDQVRFRIVTGTYSDKDIARGYCGRIGIRLQRYEVTSDEQVMPGGPVMVSVVLHATTGERIGRTELVVRECGSWRIMGKP